jgi:hypothetical protein
MRRSSPSSSNWWVRKSQADCHHQGTLLRIRPNGGKTPRKAREIRRLRRFRRFRRFEFQNLRPSAKSAENCFLVFLGVFVPWWYTFALDATQLTSATCRSRRNRRNESSESHGDRVSKRNVAELLQKPADLKSICRARASHQIHFFAIDGPLRFSADQIFGTLTQSRGRGIQSADLRLTVH